MLLYLEVLLIMLFVTTVFGYIFVVLKEKLYLKNNIIVINKKAVTQKHLDEADMKEFVLDGFRVKAGDEVKVITIRKEKFKGIIIGAKKEEKSILMVTHKDEIKQLKIDNILKFKVVSKYGKFFN